MDSGRAALGGLAGPVTSGRGEEGGGRGVDSDGSLSCNGDGEGEFSLMVMRMYWQENG